jgi:hypothetical protein
MEIPPSGRAPAAISPAGLPSYQRLPLSLDTVAGVSARAQQAPTTGHRSAQPLRCPPGNPGQETPRRLGAETHDHRGGPSPPRRLSGAAPSRHPLRATGRTPASSGVRMFSSAVGPVPHPRSSGDIRPRPALLPPPRRPTIGTKARKSSHKRLAAGWSSEATLMRTDNNFHSAVRSPVTAASGPLATRREGHFSPAG